MQIDRYIIDFFQFVHDLLWFRKGQQPRKIMDKIGKRIRVRCGFLQEIKRYSPPGVPDRDVAAWMFSPFGTRIKPEDAIDYYLICLSLGVVERQIAFVPRSTPVGKPSASIAPKRGSRRRAPDPTHRIILGRASRKLDNWNQFEAELIFSGDYDLQQSDPSRDRLAIQATRKLADILGNFEIDKIDWNFEINAIRKIDYFQKS